MSLCVIPARGGSKRIPGKNIKEFSGKPMIVWSIEAAIQTGIFNNIVVSTDDEEIARIAKDNGAMVPFVRPNELSDDFANTADVMMHACNWSKEQSIDSDYVCCIYATAPFVSADDIIAAFNILKDKNWKYVFSAAVNPLPVYRSFTQSTEGGVEMIFPEHYKTRSQDLPKVQYDAAQFYFGTFEAWVNKEIMFENHSYPFIIDYDRVQDIDTIEDWKLAEQKFKYIKK